MKPFQPPREVLLPGMAAGAVCATCLEARQRGAGPSGSAFMTPNLATHVLYALGKWPRAIAVCRWHAVGHTGVLVYTLAEWDETRRAERVKWALDK